MREYAGGRPSQSSVSPKAVPLQACFLLSGLNAQPRLRILAGSASAGGVRFLDGGNLRCFSKVRCLSEASSDFWKTLLADSRQPRSQPPTKPRRQAAHASRASLSCASLFPQKKPNQPHHSQFSFLPETHSPSTQASNFPVKTLLKKWITGPKPKAVTSVPIPTTPPVR